MANGDWELTYIRVHTPVAAEMAKVGIAQKIEWDYSGYSGHKVKISLKKDGETVMVIAKDVPITAMSYAWTPPAGLEAGDGYSIAVNSAETVYWGVSKKFSVTK